MNQFFDISKEGQPLDNHFQLNHLGKEREILAILPRRGSDYWGTPGQPAKHYNRATTAADYDLLFVDKLRKWQPVYKIDQLLDHHYQHYLQSHPEDDAFLMHMRYVIFPKIHSSKHTTPVSELFQTWLDKHSPVASEQQMTAMHHTINVGTINAPTQFQQNTNNSSQTQNNGLSKDTLIETFALIKKDMENLDEQIRSDFSMEMDYAVAQLVKEKDIKPQLLNIGDLITQVGIGMFSSLIAAPIYDIIKPHLGLH